MVGLCGIGELRNISVFVLMSIINYLILAFWLPTTGIIKQNLIVFLFPPLYKFDVSNFQIIFTVSLDLLNKRIEKPQQVLSQLELRDVRDLITNKMPLDVFATSLLPLVPSLVRFLVSIIFICSFLLRPLVMRPVSLVWARIVESEKPVFTVIFSGVAAFATAITEVAKHLSATS